MKFQKHVTPLVTFGLLFLFIVPNSQAQTKRLKRPTSRVGIQSVDQFVRESFDIYDKVYRYDGYAKAGTPLDDADIDVLEDALSDLEGLSNSTPDIINSLDGANGFKKAKAILQVNKAKKALKYSIKTAKRLLLEQRERDKENEGAENGEPDPPSTTQGGNSGQTSNPTGKNPDIQLWTQRYDFKPGSKIIFFDDFENEELGEIPSKWHYYQGLMETIKVAGEHNMVMNGDLGYGRPNWEEGFALPEAYTIEFDIFLPDPNASPRGYTSYSYAMLLYSDANFRKTVATLGIGYGSIALRGIASGKVPNISPSDLANTWNHISISVNKNSIKAYFNEYRLFNTRLAAGREPVQFKLWNCCHNTEKPVFLIDNFKVSAGAHPKYKEELLKGKIVTNNILFETGSAEIIPRSYAEIKRIADVMKANPNINFSVEGHTDNVGSDTSNKKLSKKRADSVKQALINMGVSANRLSTKGFGEEVPLKSNDTPEGRAMNRRVEFVKTNASGGATTGSGNNDTTEPQNTSDNLEIYSKFDFVPGDKLLFFDDFSQDFIGDFPSKWNTNGTGEVVKFNTVEGKWFQIKAGYGIVYMPLINKLPEEYTIEFDLLVDGIDNKTSSTAMLHVTLDDNNGFKSSGHAYAYAGLPLGQYGAFNIRVTNGNNANQINSALKADIRKAVLNKPHVSIAVNKNRFRLWVNEKKYVDIPQFIYAPDKIKYLKFNLKGLKDGKENVFISNLKIAEGGLDLRRKLMSEGRISTNGILFDSGSANIKPQSYGIIRQISQVLMQDESMNLNIIGHTDSDGSDTANLALSKKRAEAVRRALIEVYKVDASRLTSEGKGESEPVGDNSSSNGKAQNRRVEFVKI